MSDSLVQEGLASVTLSVDLRDGGVTDTGHWDTFEGGSVRASSRTYRPGGEQTEVLTVGLPTVDEITLTRGYKPSRDALHERRLTESIGRRCTVTKVLLDPSTRRAMPATRRVFSGRLTGVTTPRARSDGGDEVAMLSVTVGVEGLPA